MNEKEEIEGAKQYTAQQEAEHMKTIIGLTDYMLEFDGKVRPYLSHDMSVWKHKQERAVN